MPMRLFTAVDLDAAVRRAIGVEQRRLASGIDQDGRLKWIDPNRLHVTLVFLGEVADADAARIVELMTSDIDAPPFEACSGTWVCSRPAACRARCGWGSAKVPANSADWSDW